LLPPISSYLFEGRLFKGNGMLIIGVLVRLGGDVVGEQEGAKGEKKE
jgi:hypothetical protein